MPTPRGLRPARERITEAREAVDMSIKDLADKIKISYQHVANIENGHHKRASVGVLKAIARALRLNLEDVVGADGDQAATKQPAGR